MRCTRGLRTTACPRRVPPIPRTRVSIRRSSLQPGTARCRSIAALPCRRCNGRPASPSNSPWTLARAPISSVFRGKPEGPRGFITRGAGAVPVGRLEGRVAIVTGGSGGLGRAVALDLAREGANLVVQYGRGKDAAQAVVASMAKAGRGSVIFVGSTPAITGDRVGISYQIAKAGILGLTRALALAYGPKGVRVNALALGSITTDPMEAVSAEERRTL